MAEATETPQQRNIIEKGKVIDNFGQITTQVFVGDIRFDTDEKNWAEGDKEHLSE